MLKAPKPIRSDYLIYGILGALVLVSFLLPFSFAEKIVYSNSFPVWYEYPCADTSPTSLTLTTQAPANIWKYYSFYNGNCYLTVHTFDFQDLNNITNMTSVYFYADTRALVLNDINTVDPNQINCQLYYLGVVDTSTNLSISPTAIASTYDCTGTEGGIIQAIIPFNSANNSTLLTQLQGGNYSQSFILFPDLSNATLRSTLDSSNHDLAIAKFRASTVITGDGFNCVTIEASNWCNFSEEPWVAVKKALGEDYIGDWFYVFAFLPLPFAVFLISRNGAYAGFVCLPMILFINTIDHVIYQISLSLITLASAFGFYELIRKKLIE